MMTGHFCIRCFRLVVQGQIVGGGRCALSFTLGGFVTISSRLTLPFLLEMLHDLLMAKRLTFFSLL